MIAKVLYRIVIYLSLTSNVHDIKEELLFSLGNSVVLQVYIVDQKHLGYNFLVGFQNIHHLANVVFMAGIKNVVGV
jgi:hypothetical protein